MRILSRVHIIAHQANRYIVAFHIAILYDIYLAGGSGQATYVGGRVGTLVHTEVRSADAFRRCGQAVAPCSRVAIYHPVNVLAISIVA